LKTAEHRIATAEERARNAATLSMSPSLSAGPSFAAAPPPPPPPPTNMKYTYEIKINRTGQANFIDGEPGKPRNPRNFIVDSIVDAIKKGVTLKKTGLRDYELEDGDTIVISSYPSKDDDFNVEDAFAAMAREIAMNKQKRERNKEQNEDQKEKKKGGELDNLLAELEVLDALVDD